MTDKNYVWFVNDLSNGCTHHKFMNYRLYRSETQKGLRTYIWVFKSRAAARAQKCEHDANPFNARLSTPQKLSRTLLGHYYEPRPFGLDDSTERSESCTYLRLKDEHLW